MIQHMSVDEFDDYSESARRNLDKTVTSVVKLLVSKGLSISTAESCTGGLLSELITSVPGASQVFELGVCTYANRFKRECLNVSAEDLRMYGAVSEQVALSMARGLRDLSGADLCVSVTGLAGPDGGTSEKPVGTVYMGFVYKEHAFAALADLKASERTDRNSVRLGTARCVFETVLQLLEDGINE